MLPLGDHLPIDHGTNVVSQRIADRSHIQLEYLISQMDIGRMGKIPRVGQHFALMLGVFVEDVHRASHNLVRPTGQQVLETPQSLHRRGIHVHNLEVAIGQDHPDRGVFHHLPETLLLLLIPDLRLHVTGDVRGVLHHFRNASVGVNNRIVGPLNPDLASPLADPPELTGMKLTPSQTGPKIPVFGAQACGLVTKHAVPLPLDLRQCVAHGGQEVVVRTHDRAVRLEADHRLRTIQRVEYRGLRGGCSVGRAAAGAGGAWFGHDAGTDWNDGR